MGIKGAINPALRVRTIRSLAKIDARGAEAAARAADGPFRAAMRQEFSSEGASEGAAWQALSPAYKARKDRWFSGQRRGYKARKRDMDMLPARYQVKVAKGYGTNKILQLTGETKTRFSSAREGHVAEAVANGDQWSIRLGALSDVASYHQKGGPRLPRRPVVDLSPKTIRAIYEAMAKALAPYAQRYALALARAWNGVPRHGERA